MKNFNRIFAVNIPEGRIAAFLKIVFHLYPNACQERKKTIKYKQKLFYEFEDGLL